jgi:DNA-binding helix-turn-helix protein
MPEVFALALFQISGMAYIITYRLCLKGGGAPMRELDDARYKAIGARIREVRIQKNMSQAELAEKAFISVPHMSEVENGKTKLRLSTFVYITEALQVSADVLLRTNIPEVNGIYQGEFKDLLADCSPAEIDSILKIVKELKTTMRIKKDDYLF